MIVRTAYLRRSIVILRWWPLVIAMCAFVAPLAVPAWQVARGEPARIEGAALQKAAMLAGRMYVTGVLVLNLQDDPSVGGIGQILLRLFAGTSVLLQLMARHPREVARRLAEILHAGRVRLRHPRLRNPRVRGASIAARFRTMWKRVAIAGRVLWAMAVAVFLDGSTMANEVAALIASRGELPRIGLWKRLPSGLGPIVAADVLFVGGCGLLASAMRLR